MREILICESEFRNIIENCIEYIFDSCICYSDERKFYWNEIYEVLNISDENLRWAKLVSSEIFRLAIGEWKNIDNFKVWVED